MEWGKEKIPRSVERGFEKLKDVYAKDILQDAQQQAEELYISEETEEK